jgi:hypothetical protein
MRRRLTRARRITQSLIFAVALVTTQAAATQQAAAWDPPGPPPTPPAVPANLQVPAGNHVFLVGSASGTQQYVCLHNGTTTAWLFFAPQATLFSGGRQEITHFLSPNPDEGGTARPTWQHSRDSSTVWAAPIATSTAADYVAPGAIPWLLLDVVGDQNGPQGGDALIRTTYIQRVHTSGGITPSTGCTSSADAGTKALVPYTTDYYFYRAN